MRSTAEKTNSRIQVARVNGTQRTGSATGESDSGIETEQDQFNHAREDAYWRLHHAHQPWAGDHDSFEAFEAAYQTGYEGRGRYRGREYEDVEEALYTDYESKKNELGVPWHKAQFAIRAAWDRLEPLPSDDDEDDFDFHLHRK